MSDFNVAIAVVLQDEGGYVNNPDDPGGETNFGISKRSYPNEDIKNLTVDQAKAIYQRDWWNRYGYGAILDQELATKLLDAAINTGAKTAHTLLQKAINDMQTGTQVAVDGVLGAKTLAAINRINARWLTDQLRLNLVDYYLTLCKISKSNLTFLRGWVTRAIA